MYFDDVNLFSIREKVQNIDEFYAHTKENTEEKEKLEDHMKLVYRYFLKMCYEKNLDEVFENFEKVFFKKSSKEIISLWKELICNAIYMHDVGKVNGDFQNRKMKNERFKNISQIDSTHSMLTSCIYFNHYFNKVNSFEGEDLKLLLIFLVINSYIISKHHGILDDNVIEDNKLFDGFEDWLGKLKLYSAYSESITSNIKKTKVVRNCIRMAGNAMSEVEKTNKWSMINFYIYERFIFALMVAADYYATYDYKNDKEVIDMGTIKDINQFYSVFKKGKIYESIETYKQYLSGAANNPFGVGDINELRSQMFLEAEKNLMKNLNKNLFYLEAPTGSGKTNTSINLAFKFLEHDKSLNKIFYIFPFNTLVEQTKTSIDEMFENYEELKREVAVINSITPIRTVDREEDNKEVSLFGTTEKIDYESSLLNRQFLHYPIVLTTHVNLFNYLFGTSREEIFPLVHLCNSVIILDEIQSYRNNIWKEIIIFLKKYADLLNIKIIIMSATLPKLDKLVETDEKFVNLIENRNKYFENPLFKNRVKLDFSLLDVKENVEEVLKEKIVEAAKETNGNILVEFIKKARALNFYKELLEINDTEGLGKTILLITGDDNKVERQKIISRVKKEKDIILISTQVVEAGVNIDMDIGFKDISILDAEEQFLGRINRSCLKSNCKVYFFDMDKANLIYSQDCRKDRDITLIQQQMRDILESKDFEKFYDIVLRRIDDNLKKFNERNIDTFREECVIKLKNEEIRKRMKLIDDSRKEITLFLNVKIKLKDGTVLTGSEVWNEYYQILKDTAMSYAERKVKLSIVNEKMDYFIYKVNKFFKSYNDIIGDILYIEDGYKYFTNGKFDRTKVEEAGSCELI